MNKQIECYAKDIPEGCTIVNDIYDEKRNVLLCKAGDTADSHILALLKNYNSLVRITISDEVQLKQIQNKYHLSDEIMEHIKLDEIKDEQSLDFTDSIKEEALRGISAIYNTKDNPEEVTSMAKDISDTILSTITGGNSVNINLSKLKICDEYTYKHSVDVATMGALVAKALNYDDDFQKDVIISGLLHDLGKVEVPHEILVKDGRLTTDEFKFIQQHPQNGYNIVKDSKDISDVVKDGILYHHESMDGSGYPKRAMGSEIPIVARILTVVDVYDALVTNRPYRMAMTPSDALEVMFTMMGKFDPVIFKAFLSIIIAYPVGSLIMTSLGDVCVVIRQNEGFPLRPVIKDLNTDEVIDLVNDYNSMSVVITSFVNE